MPPLPPPVIIGALVIVIFLAIGLHEYCHAKFADMAGDPTPRLMGRVTLDLTKHFEPMGTIMIVITSIYGFGIGWGKPVMVDPRKMRNPRWDHFVSVAAGPLCNLAQATIYALFLRLALAGGGMTPIDALIALTQGRAGGTPTFLASLLTLGVVLNLSLFLFNLVPLGPLDGHWLVGAFLPEPSRTRWYIWNRQVGALLLLAFILIGQMSDLDPIGRLIGPPMYALFNLLTGLRIG